MPRIICHIDLDAFFASIEERDKPRLRGLPVVVGADPLDGRGRGVVSTANYKAREYGIRSALPIATAWRYSEAARRKGHPSAAFLEVDMEKYMEESRRVIAVVRETLRKEARGKGHEVPMEVASVDEAYADLTPLVLTGTNDAYARAEEVARAVKRAIKEKTGLTASVGVGPNKLIAKIASDREKPDGLTLVREADVERFLESLPIRTIPGVGPKTEARFKELRVRTVGDARRFSREELTDMMGKWGAELYEKLRGRDESPLVTDWVAKSVGRHETFPNDVPIASARDRKFLTGALDALAADVYGRFLADGFKSFRNITLTVRFADFTTQTRSVTLEKPVVAGPSGSRGTGNGGAKDPALKALEFQVLRLVMPFLDRRENPQRKAIRLVGIRVEKLL